MERAVRDCQNIWNPNHLFKINLQQIVKDTTAEINESLNESQKISISDLKDYDFVFIALHGGKGEDGTIQGLIDMHAIAFVGAGVLASAIGMDKTTTKSLLKLTEFPVGDFVSILEPMLGQLVDKPFPVQQKERET